MAAGKHMVIWPKARVTVDGKSVILSAGDLLPDGVSDADAANLVSFGAIAGVLGSDEAEKPEKAEKADKPKKADKAEKTDKVDTVAAKPASVKDILAEVGDDKAKAQAALDLENEAEKPRVSLVQGLQAVLSAEA
ncbi:MAG TPA: hypothetical protein VFE15_15530 [Marmoricola sp.]|jgi:hypothetical protein|nr:hypothetical protein [Marmoricola sp.]